MVNVPKKAYFHGKFTKNVFISWEIFPYCNIAVASMIKNAHAFKKFSPQCFKQKYTASSWQISHL
jgi:hypothetical protein